VKLQSVLSKIGLRNDEHYVHYSVLDYEKLHGDHVVKDHIDLSDLETCSPDGGMIPLTLRALKPIVSVLPMIAMFQIYREACTPAV
jgi:hypothetical protein